MTEALKTTAITNLDATPALQNNAGEGAPGFERVVDGYVSPAVLTVGSTYRMCRIPTNAKIKGVVVATDKALDSGTPTLAIDINIAFSDSTVDGTSVANQGTIPTTANTGTTTTVTAYASPNLMFGTIPATKLINSGAMLPYDAIFQGTNYDMAKLTTQPLWVTLGFAADPGGMFDILMYVSTAANVPVTTGALYCSVKYCE